MTRPVFFISDRTGITAETLGRSLLTQFEEQRFNPITLPFVDSVDKAEQAVLTINKAATASNSRPVIFITVVDPQLQQILATANGQIFDFFRTFINPLESALQAKSSPHMGKQHGIEGNPDYNHRIDAIHFAINCDDGVGIQHYEHADLIVIGVSRCGKTPTSLYLALQFAVNVANYPFTEEDLVQQQLPKALLPYKDRLFGLTITPERLKNIRQERRPNSRYASLACCQKELTEVEALYQQYNIPYLDTTTRSIEEIAAKILNMSGIQRHYY